MDDGSAAELRTLQRRVYGPDADLRDDATALRRLQELEGRSDARPDPTTAPDAVEPPSPSTAEQPATTQAEASATTPAEASPGVTPRSPRRWSRATLAALWAVSLVVAGVVAVGTAQTLAPPPTGQVATLSVDPDAPWPDWLRANQEDVDIFEDYHGLSVIAMPAEAWGRDDTARCLVVLADEQFIGDGCGAGAFGATVAVLITATSPESLRDRFGVGTALELSLEGDSTVIVRSDAG